MQHCAAFSMDPSLGICLFLRINFDPVLTFTTFTETTSSLVEATQSMRLTYDSILTLSFDGN